MEILKVGDPILRQESAPLEKDYPNLKQIIIDMVETMEHNNGIGLAAPQVGLSVRLFIIKTEEGRIKHFINPEIMDYSFDKSNMEEGCLSVDNLIGTVSRPTYIKASWYDSDFNRHEEDLNVYMSRVFQHENDHLDGVLLVDYLV